MQGWLLLTVGTAADVPRKTSLPNGWLFFNTFLLIASQNIMFNSVRLIIGSKYVLRTGVVGTR